MVCVLNGFAIIITIVVIIMPCNTIEEESVPGPILKGTARATAKGMVWSKELKKGGPGAGEMVNKENLKGRGVGTGCQSMLAWLYPLDMEQARLELPAPGDDGPVKNWVTTLHTPAPPPLHCTLRLYSLSVNHKWLNELMG